MSSCPISLQKVDENSVRLNSIFVAFLSLVAIFFDLYFLLAVLMVDFVIKSVNPLFSPFSRVANMVIRFFGVKNVQIDYAPKRFAAFVAATLFALSLFFWYFDLPGVSLAILVIIVVCALLEGILSYCVGCKVYNIFSALKR